MSNMDAYGVLGDKHVTEIYPTSETFNQSVSIIQSVLDENYDSYNYNNFSLDPYFVQNSP